MKELFQEIIYIPLFNSLVFLYERVAFEDLGVAIILLTISVRIILYPVFHKTAKHQRLTQELQPHIKKIKEKHKDDREAQTKAIMDLYKEHSINPFTPFVLLLLQLPILLALYKIFINGLSNGVFDTLYPFVPKPEKLNETFLGIVALNKPSAILAAITAAAQYAQGKISLARLSGERTKQEKQMARMTLFVVPAIALVFLTRFPAAVALYWLTSTVFSIIQQVIANKAVSIKPVKPDKNE